MQPFLWRLSLDFYTLHDIHSIKRQIYAHRGGASIEVAGHNVKLGRGGIREIEFFAQTEQLIWGGRLPQLRVAPTCAALRALADADRISHLVADELSTSYAFLRRVARRFQCRPQGPPEPGREALRRAVRGGAEPRRARQPRLHRRRGRPRHA